MIEMIEIVTLRREKKRTEFCLQWHPIASTFANPLIVGPHLTKVKVEDHILQF